MSSPNPGEGGVIIIKGGSLDVDYDEGMYPRDPENPRSHKNQARKITRVLITGDINFDSTDQPQGLSCTITISSR